VGSLQQELKYMQFLMLRMKEEDMLGSVNIFVKIKGKSKRSLTFFQKGKFFVGKLLFY
jgi:hypothetical protein